MLERHALFARRGDVRNGELGGESNRDRNSGTSMSRSRKGSRRAENSRVPRHRSGGGGGRVEGAFDLGVVWGRERVAVAIPAAQLRRPTSHVPRRFKQSLATTTSDPASAQCGVTAVELRRFSPMPIPQCPSSLFGSAHSQGLSSKSRGRTGVVGVVEYPEGFRSRPSSQQSKTQALWEREILEGRGRGRGEGEWATRRMKRARIQSNQNSGERRRMSEEKDVSVERRMRRAGR